MNDFVYLKVSPLRGIRFFHVHGKLAPRYIGSYRIVERRGEVPYQLELPPQLSYVHDVFHVLQLKKFLRTSSELTQLENIDLQTNLSFQEHPIRILDEATQHAHIRTIKILRVQWSNHTEDEAT